MTVGYFRVQAEREQRPDGSFEERPRHLLGRAGITGYGGAPVVPGTPSRYSVRVVGTDAALSTVAGLAGVTEITESQWLDDITTIPGVTTGNAAQRFSVAGE